MVIERTFEKQSPLKRCELEQLEHLEAVLC